MDVIDFKGGPLGGKEYLTMIPDGTFLNVDE
jgi:hypothetical protein